MIPRPFAVFKIDIGPPESGALRIPPSLRLLLVGDDSFLLGLVFAFNLSF